MSIPTYDTLMRPILVRATKEPITRRSMTEAMVKEFKLTDEERAELLPSGSATYINNRVGWPEGDSELRGRTCRQAGE
jgi:restriction system protein